MKRNRIRTKIRGLIALAVAGFSLSARPSVAVIGYFGWAAFLTVCIILGGFFSASRTHSPARGVAQLIGLLVIAVGLGCFAFGGPSAPLIALEFDVAPVLVFVAVSVLSFSLMALGFAIRHFALRAPKPEAA